MKKIIAFVFAFCFLTPGKAQNRDITSAGDIIQIAIPAAALTSAFIYNDDGSKPVRQFFLAYGSGFILQQSLKHIVLKPRPDGSNNYSFPSGHTTCAFTGAAFIQRRYGWKYGVPSYLLASFVGYSRIQAKKHDGWDVLAGATIGIGANYIFTKPYQKKVQVSFNNEQNGYQLGLTYTF
ncbi:phosphatase PAP2 family protein [Flavobacterium sp. CYK-55]|uniref:phosphatase PAP2 family protein n=1 Tax=Flavobacterium sp. CYK-55 TaxID=2835529 RepID=UPI001BD184A5|nr:phosphatase PAP2 family protein [Flavobacterium sp. CYK-55]MBS7786939.1 phosphatase PAP2 family protein [Flavobacterium sp. CYK-55]